MRAGAHLRLKPGRERSLLRRHPWVFSGAIDAVAGSPQSGATVRVCAADGKFLAWAAYSPASQIRARVWTFDEREEIDAAFFMRRVTRSVEMRAPMLDTRHNGCRLTRGRVRL